MRVGIHLPIGERGEERRALPYQHMRDMAHAAEASGLDSIWVADHLFIRGHGGGERGAWESLTVLAGLADATRRVELGPLVLCTPFRNPGLIAWMANTLDEVSGGRFVLGLGSGWHPPEFEAFGFEFDHRVSLFADALEVIVPLLRAGRVAYEGQWAKGAAELRPAGPRRGGPPILIASVAPRMMTLAARWADRWNSVWYGLPTDEFRAERRRLGEACAAIGRDVSEIEITAGLEIGDPAPEAADNGPAALAGTVEQVAAGLHAWQAEGVSEVMCRLQTPTVAGVEMVAAAARTLIGSSS